ncbi:SUMF1/EgtB/PvdO family nonheme iron enzyme [Streptomyces himalayensis]|nr:SUMF1/EgtB/PvdO family nonheme iron enzyme [Streptomyces himalayensis]
MECAAIHSRAARTSSGGSSIVWRCTQAPSGERTARKAHWYRAVRRIAGRGAPLLLVTSVGVTTASDFRKCNVRETGVEHTTSVSRYHSGVSPYGVYDMVGNVWEWLATPTTPGRYELRGSAFTSPLFRGVPAVPNDANDTMHDDDTGFRCVATPDQMTSRKRVRAGVFSGNESTPLLQTGTSTESVRLEKWLTLPS